MLAGAGVALMLAKRLLGDTAVAAAILSGAAELARSGPKPRLRDILSEWSELMAESGDVAKAIGESRKTASSSGRP